MLLRVYCSIASPLWLELRGLSAWQATPFWTVYQLICHQLLPWLRVTFAMVPDAAWGGSEQRPWGTAIAARPLGRLGRPRASHPWDALCCYLSLRGPRRARGCGVLGPFALVHRCGCLECSLCGVLGHLAPVHRCVPSGCCAVHVVSWATWLLFTSVHARPAVLCVRCSGPLGSCSPMCTLGVMVLRVRCPGPSLFLLTGVYARRVVLRVRCSWLLCSCSLVCMLRVLCWVCGVLGHLAPVHWCARGGCFAVCAASWASWLLFTGVHTQCIVLCLRCSGPPGSFSPVCTLCVLCCMCAALRHLAPLHLCAHSLCCGVCAVSWAAWLLFTTVPARCVVLCVWCPGRPSSCSPVCTLGVLCCICGVQGRLVPVQRCACSACCAVCVVS